MRGVGIRIESSVPWGLSDMSLDLEALSSHRVSLISGAR